MAENGEAYDPKKDPKRRAKSKDPGWKYAYWPTEDKNVVECLLCEKIISSGIKRMKQHLLGGFGDVLVCEKSTTAIKREMQAWLDRKRRKMPVEVDNSEDQQGGDDGDDGDVQEGAAAGQQPSQASATASGAIVEATPSSGTASKKRNAAAALFKMAAPSKQLKIPLDWWKSNGGLALPLTKIARRIVGLCCSSSACERNWSTFELIHTKKRNRLLHKTLDDLSYVSFNTKIDARFAKIHREGNKVNPLFLEEFQWDNEWVDKDAEVAQRVHADDDLTWDQVDSAATSSSLLLRRNQPRGGHGVQSEGNFYTRRGPAIVDELDHDPFVCDDEDVDDDDVLDDEDPSTQGGGAGNDEDEDDDLEYDDDDDDMDE